MEEIKHFTKLTERKSADRKRCNHKFSSQEVR